MGATVTIDVSHIPVIRTLEGAGEERTSVTIWWQHRLSLIGWRVSEGHASLSASKMGSCDWKFFVFAIDTTARQCVMLS